MRGIRRDLSKWTDDKHLACMAHAVYTIELPDFIDGSGKPDESMWQWVFLSKEDALDCYRQYVEYAYNQRMTYKGEVSMEHRLMDNKTGHHQTVIRLDGKPRTVVGITEIRVIDEEKERHYEDIF